MSGEALANDLGYVHLCLPMEFEPDNKCTTVIGFEDPRKEEAELLFPERFPVEVVERDKEAMTPYAVAGQFQQRPAPRGGGMFRTENFRIIPDFFRTEAIRSVRYWDKAGTEGGGAYSAGVLMHKLRDGTQVVEDVQRGQWSSLTREVMIKQTAAIDRKLYPNVVVWIEQEPGSGGKESAENTVRKLAGHIVRVDRVSMSKEERAGVNDPVKARSYSAQVEAGNVLLVAGDWNRPFIDEHSKFPTGKYKDQVDAASGAFNKLQAIDDTLFGSWDTLKRAQGGRVR
uniref:Putative terminase n=1 Tax=viral metagenome TaxID=1070528 RepID=A0A6M3L1U3_9ZZZZ